MRTSLLAPLAAILAAGCSGDEISEDEVTVYRSVHCPINPDQIAVGDFVRIKVSGQKGQVLDLPSYTYGTEDYYDGELEEYACRKYPDFSVRVNTHGIALDSGLWDTARPEVLPVIRFEHFEIEPWTEQEQVVGPNSR